MAIKYKTKKPNKKLFGFFYYLFSTKSFKEYRV